MTGGQNRKNSLYFSLLTGNYTETGCYHTGSTTTFFQGQNLRFPDISGAFDGSVTVSRNMRYSRQTILSEIGTAGQEKLSAARALVVGAGGLGCPALLYLAGAGIGTIGIADFDRVDESNLQRQVLFTAGDCGAPKATAAKVHLSALNPGIAIHAYDEELTDRNADGLLSGYDLVIDGTDNFAAKFLINDVAVKLGKPVIYGAIQGFEAQISVFSYNGGPCYRCLHPQEPQAQIMNCAENGIIGAVAGIAGTMQAMEAIKIIVEHESFKPLSGRLWMMDAKTMEVNVVNVSRSKNCPVCSLPPAEIVLKYASPVCTAAQVKEITCEEAAAMNAPFLDVREKEEWEAGHIDGARHMPLSSLKENPYLFRPFSAKTPCILYCQRGRRSAAAAEILLRAGFTGLYSMAGGYEAWCAEDR